MQFTRRSFKPKFSWALIEAHGYLVEVVLRVAGQIGFPGKVLSQQSVGVLVRATLLRALRIPEVDVHLRGYRKAPVFRSGSHDGSRFVVTPQDRRWHENHPEPGTSTKRASSPGNVAAQDAVSASDLGLTDYSGLPFDDEELRSSASSLSGRSTAVATSTTLFIDPRELLVFAGHAIGIVPPLYTGTRCVH